MVIWHALSLYLQKVCLILEQLLVGNKPFSYIIIKKTIMKKFISGVLTMFIFASFGCSSAEKQAEQAAQQRAAQKEYQKQDAEKAHRELDREVAQ